MDCDPCVITTLTVYIKWYVCFMCLCIGKRIAKWSTTTATLSCKSECRLDHYIDVAESRITRCSIMSSKGHTSCICNSKHIQITEIRNDSSYRVWLWGCTTAMYIVIMQVNSSYFINSYSCFSINIAFVLILTSYSAWNLFQLVIEAAM